VAIAMRDWNDGHWGAGDWLAMTSMMVLFWVVVIVLVIWAVRSFAGRDSLEPGTGKRLDARELLAERFARGEIDEDEFRRGNQALDESRARHPSGGSA
jgi:putative membrane protein